MTAIEWTELTWNPIVGCSLVSPGCTNCYAMGQAARLLDRPGSHYEGTTQRVNGKAVWTGKVARAPDRIFLAPFTRRTPTVWFVNSMGDLFHEDADDNDIADVFFIMAQCPEHTFQVLTKRSARMRALVGDQAFVEHIRASLAILDEPGRQPLTWPLPNVWLGVSTEDQRRADERIPDLLATPAAVRFVSAEPLLGPIDFKGWLTAAWDGDRRKQIPAPRVTWVIVGGESGSGARPMVLGWAKDIVRQCQTADVSVFVKQMGSHPTNREGERCHHIKDRKGADMAEWPEELRIRQMPTNIDRKAA